MKRMNGMIIGTALAVAALLSACAGGPETKELHATLTSGQEAPPVSGPGSGQATLWLNTGTKQLNWKVSYSGLSSDAAAAHIHGPAAPGANAGVVVNLAPNGVKNPIEGSATLTDAQIADLLAGNDYVNIHTGQNKGGEIRGQIKN
jgi:hypothetical protein